MTTHIDAQRIQAAMIRGRTERALAFQRAAQRITSGLRHSARTLVAIFA